MDNYYWRKVFFFSIWVEVFVPAVRRYLILGAEEILA